MKKKKLLLGAHISTEGGLYKAVERAESIGCTTFQLFTKSNRQWKASNLTQESIDAFKEAVKNSSFTKDTIFAHAGYLINLGSPDALVEKKSIESLAQEVERCALLEIPYLVLHPGSHVNTNEIVCLKQIVKNLDHILTHTKNSVTITLETMAGQGSVVGRTFEQLQFILTSLKHHKARLGVCVDTCHIFAAGYDFRDKKSYHALWKSFDQTIGMHHLKVMHINDSKTALGSFVDRHETIGKGSIGKEGFALLLNDKNLADIPKILETPINTLQDYAKDFATIKSLIKTE